MELAGVVHSASVSRDVVKQLRCHNFESIRPMLQRLSDKDQFNDAISMAFLELGALRNTPHLDVIFKSKLREEQMMLSTIRSEIIAFNREWFRIDRELEGTEKHDALYKHFSGEEVPYKPWCNDESVLTQLDTG